jgi:UDP-glucose 4-epimerase
MNIAISGGNGFIGRAVQKAAREAGHHAWAFDKAAGDDVRGDLSGLGNADAVIHLAGILGTAELFDTPELAIDVNVNGTLNVLQWCRTHGAAYVGITMPDAFPSVYTATKIAAQRLATAWHHTYGVPVSHVRAFNAYGPGQAHGVGHPQKILPTFAVNAWAGVPLPVWGDGTQTVDLVHADDVGRMLVDAVRFGDDQVFDAGTGVPVRVNDLAHIIMEHTGSQAEINYLPMRAGEKPTQIVAQGEGWDLLDWHPSLDLDKVLAAVDSYK